MKVLKKQINACKILLCVSVLINILLAGVVYVAEKRSMVFATALERRNLITLSDRALPDYWSRNGWTNTVKSYILSLM